MITNLETLKSSSIVGVIERYIPLRKNGANFIACCPFHSEKSPSFVVSDVKGMFKCFGCGKGGDALSFIKEYERIDFNEAVKRLSELTGIALEYDKAQRVGKSPSEVLEKINALAKSELAKNAAIVEYLAQRGLTAEICEKYDIGLVPSKSQLLQHFSAADLVESGFANKYSALGKHSGDSKDFGTTADRQSSSAPKQATAVQGEAEAGFFRKSLESPTSPTASPRILQEKQANAQNISIPMHHRICIAIRNPQHKVVAFVSRTHPHYNFTPNAPKYINSKESYFYKKTQILYLYSNAKSHIQAQNAAFVVEGYIDSILLHENGFKNAIATGGTAFNVQHLNLLTRLDCEVIFCFDNDKSGMAANFRAVKVCFGAGFYKVKVAILQNRDTKGKRCKDINEALLAMDSKETSANAERYPLFSKEAALCHALQGKARNDDNNAQNLTNSQATKLDFKYLSGFEFFIKWLYKNKDKQQAFNEIKAAISACQNFYDKQEFLDTACKLTGVPQEYFTQDKIPTKQPKDDYNTLIASILHSEECAYIATELDLSFIPQHKQLQAFLQTGENKELSGFIEVKPLDSNEFYQHYCDLYLAHLSREQTKARAKKDLKLVLVLSEKIAQVQQDIQAQKAF